ncbi:MAG TPA: DNA topoisomerase IB [Acidimicrobiia bacterium]|jgi:DNA topoisomerase-1|nr:DNA topoisomerase IB [Acidimicrobiia bacterium]
MGNADLLAGEAGLSYVVAGAAGYRRVRRGRGFSYLDSSGATVNGPIKTYIESLVIPPAWNEVWVSKDRLGHILATGVDSAGRKQYIYHPKWEEIRDEVKFERLGPFATKLPVLRKKVDADLRTSGLAREKVVALAVAVLDRTLVRVGSARYAAENESYGLTTLTHEHVETDGPHVHLAFTGKGGAEHQLVFRDRRLARLVGECQDLAGQTLFSYELDSGGTASIQSTDVNRYLEDATGMPFTAKDFRTWGASAVVTGELASSGASVEDHDAAVLAAIDVAAETLGNTRAVARSSYVHPAIIDAHACGELGEAWRRSRSGRWLVRSESTLSKILEGET